MGKNTNKKMLSIGYNIKGIKSITWEEISEVNITDFQIILIDLENYSNYEKSITGEIGSLYLNYHTIVYLLPSTKKILNKVVPFGFQITESSGSTLNFHSSDQLIEKLKEYFSNHEVVIDNFTQIQSQFAGHNLNWEKLITNNVNKICGVNSRNLYILIQPDSNRKSALVSKLVEHFNPVKEYEIESKPSWVEQYEINFLETSAVKEKITKIEKNIINLEEDKDNEFKKLEELNQWSELIYLKGNSLELRIKNALEFLGIVGVEHEPRGSHGPDLTIEHNEFHFTIEIEGSKGPIRVNKVRELLEWMVHAPHTHKGLLIGNPFCELPLDDRPPENYKLYGKEAVSLAEARNLLLITSSEIFKLVSKKIKGEKLEIEAILNDMINSSGFKTKLI